MRGRGRGERGRSGETPALPRAPRGNDVRWHNAAPSPYDCLLPPTGAPLQVSLSRRCRFLVDTAESGKRGRGGRCSCTAVSPTDTECFGLSVCVCVASVAAAHAKEGRRRGELSHTHTHTQVGHWGRVNREKSGVAQTQEDYRTEEKRSSVVGTSNRVQPPRAQQETAAIKKGRGASRRQHTTAQERKNKAASPNDDEGRGRGVREGVTGGGRGPSRHGHTPAEADHRTPTRRPPKRKTHKTSSGMRKQKKK